MLLNVPNRYGAPPEIFAWQLYRYDKGSFREKLIENNYDGIIQHDSNYGKTNDTTTYVALYPNQIKSINNTIFSNSEDINK
jgi:hypothetical protein